MAGSDAMQNIGSALGGGPTSKQVLGNMQYLQGPDKSNYQVGGLDQYNQQTQALAGQAGAANQSFQANANGLGAYNSGLANQGASQQSSAFNQLQNMANGTGPSLAGANLQAGLNNTNAALQSQAMSSAGGAGAGNSQRNLLNAQTAAANAAGQQAATASTAEQMGAVGQLSNAADSMRSANLQQAAAAAGAGSTLRGQNLSSDLGSQQNSLSALNSGMAANQQQAQNNMQYDAAQQALGAQKAGIGQAATAAGAASGGMLGKQAMQLVQSGVQGAAGALTGGLSDENAKTDIKDDSGSSMKSFFGSLANGIASKAHTDMARQHAADPYGDQQSVAQKMGGGLGAIAGNLIGHKMAEGRAADAQAAALDQWRQTGKLPAAGAPQAAAAASPSDGAGMVGGILGNVLSDERQKTDIHSQDFMDHLEPKSFEYKNPDAPGAAQGRVHGVMAQDMEKSAVGQGMVEDTPQGKMFDMPKAVSATLNGLATLNQRIDELEKMRRAPKAKAS